MGRKKTKYTKTDACIYIMYRIINNEFNTIDSLLESLDISSRQLRRYVSVINLALSDFMIEQEIIFDKQTRRFTII